MSKWVLSLARSGPPSPGGSRLGQTEWSTKNMARNNNDPDLRGGRMRVPRSRGAASGFLLLILGAWGALVPLIGPYVNFGYTPNTAFHFSTGRVWLEVLPGAVVFAGGFLLLVAANRLITSLGAWLAVVGGVWFLVGPTLHRLLHLGAIGMPIHKTTLGSTLETLLLFTGIGALILFLGALAVGRLGVVSVRDVKAAQRREADKQTDKDRGDGNEHGERQAQRGQPHREDESRNGRADAYDAERPVTSSDDGGATTERG